MTYESVPKDEFDTGLSIDTYRKCAYKEFWDKRNASSQWKLA